MTPKQAYRMGFRHVSDLIEINRIADLFMSDRDNEQALQLMEAWREGAMAAAAMLERAGATLQ